MEKINNIKKYPKSKKGFQCLGPCREKNVPSIHPILLDTIISNNPYCPVAGYQVYDKNEKKYNTLYIDDCNKVDTNIKHDKDDDLLNNLLPYMDFNIKDFLLIFYDIKSFEDGIDVIAKQINFRTKIRLFESMLNVFGKNIDIIDHRIIDFFIELVKSTYATKLYEALSSYIDIDVNTNKVKISKTVKKNKKKDDNVIIKTNFIIKSFINSDITSKFLFKYFKNKKEVWENIYNYVEDMINEFINYIINIINVSE